MKDKTSTPRRKPSAVHYELWELMINAFAKAILINIPVLIILLVVSDYPIWLGTIDATITILTAVFLIVIFPLMLSGKIPAYYQRWYSSGKLKVKIFAILISCPMRAVVTFGVLFASIGLADSRKSRYISELYEYLLNPKVNLIAFIIFAAAIFYLFYFKKCFKISEYREGMIKASHRVSNPTEKRCYQRLVDESLNRAYFSAQGNNCLEERVEKGATTATTTIRTTTKPVGVKVSGSESKVAPVKKSATVNGAVRASTRAGTQSSEKDTSAENMVRRRARNI